MHARCAVLTLALTVALPAGGRAEDDPATAVVELKKGDHVLFFGDSLPAFQSAAGVAQHLLGRATRPVLVLHHPSPGEPCAVKLHLSEDVL